MAENSNILITVTTDSEGAVSSIDKLGSSVNNAGGNVDGLKAQLSALQKEFDKVAATAPGGGRYQELVSEISSVREQIKNASDAINNEAVPAFAGFADNTSGAADALGSFDLKGFGDQIKNSAENVNNFKFGSIKEGLKSTTQGFSSLGKALIANPLFAIGQVIIYLVQNFETLAEALPGLSGLFNAVGDAVGFVKGLVTSFTDAIGLTAVAATEAVDGAIASLEDSKKDLENQQRLAIAEARKTGKSVEDVKKEFRENDVKANEDLINQIDALEKKGVKLTEKQLEARAKAIAANKETAIKIAEEEADAVQKAREEAAKAEEKRLADEEKAREAARAKAKERAEKIKANEKEVTDAIKASKEEQFQATLSAEEKELRQVALKYDALKEKAGANKELQKQIFEQERIELQGIRDKYFNEELKAISDAEAKRIETERAAAFKANADRITREDNFFKIDRELEYKRIEEKNGIALANREKAVDELVSSYDEKFALANGNAEQEKKLQEQQKRDLANIEKRYRTEQADADSKSAAERIAKILQVNAAITASAQETLTALGSINEIGATKNAAALADLDKQIEDAKTEDQKKALESRRKILEDEGKKIFERNKKLQIAQATITTYQNAVAAASSQYVTGDPTSVIRAVIAATAAVAAGLANIAKIKATTFTSSAPSGGGGGASGASGGGTSGLASTGVASSGAPEFNPLSALNFNQPQQIQPAYVLASDIASSMEARSKVEDLSRL